MNGLIILAILFFIVVFGGAIIFEVFAYKAEQKNQKGSNFQVNTDKVVFSSRYICAKLSLFNSAFQIRKNLGKKTKDNKGEQQLF